MIGSGIGVRTRSWIVPCLRISLGISLGICLGMLAAPIAGTPAAAAADCPGHPDALGTSRTVVVDPREHPRIGTMQYRETLPLRDHEVVLTFDDGPLPKYSNQVLQILANECIKATFFIVGRQAQANPEGVRKLVAAGHTVGTHSQNHPLTFEKMPVEKAKAEIDGGIASTTAALSDPSALAPFFRIPGLLRAQGVEDLLASRGIQVWSADFPADDWRHVSGERVHQLAMQRLEAKGKGILLLHDIQPRTVAALPKIIHDLKARGYRIVHVVPATADRPATPTEPTEWLLHPQSESVPVARWPKIPNFVFAQGEPLPAPALADLNAELPRQPALPRRSAGEADAAALPVPGRDVFEIPEKSLAVLLTTSSRRGATRTASAETGHRSHAVARGKARTPARSHGRQHAHAAHTAPKGTTGGTAAKPRPTRLASLKKR
ncbi:polysaccharide deacetylase family protein [Bradyrhizobium sp.]|uniref:polysaccharide deacetylase family protein n=1 Tax=Bradyrhizobium sp. TaxID=376 RepID=UPI00238F48FE|nr:polysaccharide deacetylase family protein [Bradyrhizobium sp.]MDE2376873.1 polysaccharide deacetylase family protein [Bradyrhizobium sp.]